MSAKWTADLMPDQSGRIVTVTGGNSGLGFETTKALAGAGAHVILACRNTRKGEQAAGEIRADNRDAAIDIAELDLASLESVRSFADQVRAAHPVIDLMVNNAGVMAPPRAETADGFELQFGTNHLGHFALTGLLLDALKQGSDARVVTVSSIEHKPGRLHFDDLQSERSYSPRGAYQQSK